jgi:hypothetical protein
MKKCWTAHPSPRHEKSVLIGNDQGILDDNTKSQYNTTNVVTLNEFN